MQWIFVLHHKIQTKDNVINAPFDQKANYKKM